MSWTAGFDAPRVFIARLDGAAEQDLLLAKKKGAF